MSEIRFFVPGIPQSGGSKTGFPIYRKQAGAKVFTGKVAQVEAGTAKSRERKKEWRAKVSLAAQQHVSGNAEFPAPGPFEIELFFYLPRPKDHYRSDGMTLRPNAGLYHVSAPDAGKLARGTQDSLKGILFRDDSQIVKETHTKNYSNQPGCWIILNRPEGYIL